MKGGEDTLCRRLIESRSILVHGRILVSNCQRCSNLRLSTQGAQTAGASLLLLLLLDLIDVVLATTLHHHVVVKIEAVMEACRPSLK